MTPARTLATLPAGRTAGWLTRPMLAFFAVMGSLPLWFEAVGLYPYLAVEIAIWMIYAFGFNLLFGYGGLHSFGHGAYFGVGAYAFGLLQLRVVESLWLGLAGALLAGLLAGAVVGLFVAHRRGIYFALLTIAFGQVFWFVASKWHSVTGGMDGLLNIPRPPATLGPLDVATADNWALYGLTLGVLAAVVLLLWRVVHAPFGRILQAVRQNETRAAFVGHHVWLYKWAAFTASAAIAGLAGGLFSMAQQSAYPDVMALHASGFIVMMTLVGGGLVSFWGPAIGVAVFFLARDVLGAATEAWLLWYGLMFMGVVLFRPEGIAGIWHDLAALLARRRAVARAGFAAGD